MFYDKDYDELRQSGDDIVKKGESEKEKHYCRMYNDAINEKITEGKKPCEYHSE